MPAFGLGFGLTFAQPGGGAAASPLLTDLVSYYKLEDVNDSHGANSLTNTNAVTFTAGKLNNAGTFASASSQKLTKTSAVGLSMNSAGSISCWVKRNGAAGTLAGMVEVGTSGVESMGLAINATQVYLLGYHASSLTTLIIETGALANATWTHYVATWATGANNTKLYKNGAVDGTATLVVPTLTANITLGYFAAGPTYLNGQLDEVGLWNRALTLAEVQQLYGSGTPPGYPTF